MASDLIRRELVDALLITTYPVYTAALGPLLKRRFRVPFVVDLQDPWVGAWGSVVGGGLDGSPDLKSRLSRWLAARLEPSVFGAADAVVAVSARTYEDVRVRVPAAREKPCTEIPLGGDARDFEAVARLPARHRHFDSADGLVHLCSVGTLLPLGVEVARALFAAVSDLRRRRPDAAARLCLHFFGTSNERAAAAPRVVPLAAAVGVADLVTEEPSRIDYLDAVRVQCDASALLLLGSTEPHYTASRLYPALLAKRPLLAIYHEASSVAALLRHHTRTPTVQLITFDDSPSVDRDTGAISSALETLADGVAYDPASVDPAAFRDYSARALAGRLAAVLSQVA
jgi:hypothetical protein